MDEFAYNPSYPETEEEARKRGNKYPDTITAFKAAAARIAEIKRQQKERQRKPKK